MKLRRPNLEAIYREVDHYIPKKENLQPPRIGISANRKDYTIIPTRINTIKRIPDIPGRFLLFIGTSSYHNFLCIKSIFFCNTANRTIFTHFFYQPVYLLGKLLMRPLLKCNAYF